MACTTRFTIYSCLLYPFSVRHASTKNPGILPGPLIIFSLASFPPLSFETLYLPRTLRPRRASYAGSPHDPDLLQGHGTYSPLRLGRVRRRPGLTAQPSDEASFRAPARRRLTPADEAAAPPAAALASGLDAST
jgi:hypothetical protein